MKVLLSARRKFVAVALGVAAAVSSSVIVVSFEALLRDREYVIFGGSAESRIRSGELDKILTSIDVIDERLEHLEGIYSSSDPSVMDELVLAGEFSRVTQEQSQLRREIGALKLVLESDPERVIEVIRTRDRLEDFDVDLNSLEVRTAAQVDRIYTIVFGTNIAIVLLLVSLVIARIFTSKSESK